jgi:hypothetical protein
MRWKFFFVLENLFIFSIKQNYGTSMSFFIFYYFFSSIRLISKDIFRTHTVLSRHKALYTGKTTAKQPHNLTLLYSHLNNYKTARIKRIKKKIPKTFEFIILHIINHNCKFCCEKETYIIIMIYMMEILN